MMRYVVILNDYILTVCNEMCQGPLKEQSRIMNINVAEYKMFVGLVSDSTLQLAFKILSLAKFWGVSKTVNRKFPGSPVVGDSGLSLLRAQVGFLVGELRSQKLHGTAKPNKQNIPNNLNRLLKYSLFQVSVTVRPDLHIFQPNNVS